MWQQAHAAAVGVTRDVARTAHAAPHPPTWAMVVGIVVGVLLASRVALVLLSNPRPPGRNPDDDQGSGPSGGGPGRPGPDGGDAPGGTPALWAEFERDFAAYVSERAASLR